MCIWRKYENQLLFLYVLVICYQVHIVIFLLHFCYPFKSQQLMKHNSDVKTESNGSLLTEKKDKKVKKSQSADSTSSKETRKDRKISRKRVCIILNEKKKHFWYSNDI